MDLFAPVLDRDEALTWRSQARDAGRSVVFTNGCFDLLHQGHVDYLAKAKKCGDVLVVAVNTDASVRRLKGPDRPVTPQDVRVRVLAALRSVDMVILFSEDTPLELIRELQPDVLVKGADYAPSEVVGRQEVLSWGGRVELIPLTPGQSTTTLLHSLKKRES